MEVYVRCSDGAPPAHPRHATAVSEARNNILGMIEISLVASHEFYTHNV